MRIRLQVCTCQSYIDVTSMKIIHTSERAYGRHINYWDIGASFTMLLVISNGFDMAQSSI